MGEEREQKITQVKLIARNSGYSTSDAMSCCNKRKGNENVTSAVDKVSQIYIIWKGI
jgi:hypothetical protein